MAYIQDWGMRVQAQPQINTTRRAFLHLSQNENGRMLNIRITDVNIPSGSTAVLAGTKPDGTVYSQAGTLAGNTATFAEDVQMTAVAGTWDAKITVTNGGNCICTARITITIDPDTVAGGAIPSDSQLDGIIAECRAIADSVRKEAYGSPLVADAVEDMTDQSRVYVYTGSESGMTAGHWYYYDGTAWTDGGVYNAIAVDTDTTLTIAGKAADAKEVGDQLADVKEDFKATGLESTPYIERHNGVMNWAGSSWMYTTDPKYQHIVLPVTPGQFFKITQGTVGDSFWAFLKSYSTESAPDLSTGTSRRQNSSTEMLVPDDANYLYVNVNDNGTVTIPKVLIVGDWDFSATAKSQLLANVENVYNCMLRNTPIAIINGNRIPISKTSFTSGTVNIGFEEPDTITLGGSYSSGVQRVTLNTGTLKANTKYTFFVKNTDGLVPTVGLADSGGFITYQGEKVETTNWNKAIVFETGNSALTGVYAYLRVTASSLNNKLSIYVVEGELKEDDFYIYDKKYVNSRLFGKKVAWYGDSITQGYGWCSAINSLFDFVATNCGSGGSRISYTDTRDDSMCLTSRMQGDYTPTSGEATAIPSDVDIIFVEGGTNDWGNNINTGSAEWKQSLDNTVFAEACHIMFDNLTTLFPNVEIIVLGAPWAKWAGHFTDAYGILNNRGLQTVDYGDMLLDVAGRWGIKGINMSRLIGFNDNNVASLTSDGIHPNTSGASKIASAVISYLLSL